MNRLLTILLLAAGTAYGQINNPPTSVNIVDSTATGRAVLTATNAAAAATAVGLGTTNNVTFNRVQVGGSSFTADNFSGGDFEITAGHALTFASGGAPGATLTNLGLGATNNVEFRRLKMIAADAADNGDDATLWLDTSGTNKYATMRLSGTGGSAEKYNAYLTAGPQGLNITATPGFRVLNGGTANTGSVLFAVNSSGNATLNGTANLAPSQTASSGSSLMTRDLSDARYGEAVRAGVSGVALTTNNTTLEDIAGLSIPLAVGLHQITTQVFFSANAAAGSKMAMTFDGTGTPSGQRQTITTSVAQAVAMSSFGSTSSATASEVAHVRIYTINVTAAGTLQVQGAQNVAGNNSITATGFLKAERL
jgi:hypothetical protein